MLLAIDIGNTTIGIAIVHKGKVLSVSHVDTVIRAEDLKKLLRPVFTHLKRQHLFFDRVVICSVVPKATAIVESYIEEVVQAKTYVVGRDIKVPMVNRYLSPGQVGQDRLVGAFAAMTLYAAGKPLIVVDLGTAITFDVVSAKGEYLGGAIVPGLRLSAESLFLKTALLPQIPIKAPKHVIGRTTQESILSGLFYGYGCLCQGFIELISKQLKVAPKVVMTGGHTQLMKKFIAPKIRIIDENLVFKGAALLAKGVIARN